MQWSPSLSDGAEGEQELLNDSAEQHTALKTKPASDSTAKEGGRASEGGRGRLRERHTSGQADRQADRQAERQAERQTDREAEREKEREGVW